MSLGIPVGDYYEPVVCRLYEEHRAFVSGLSFGGRLHFLAPKPDRFVEAAPLPELTGKLGPAVSTESVDGQPARPAAPDWEGQVHTGLVGLGWSSRDADGAVEAIRPVAADQLADGEVNVGALLRAALQRLSRG